VRGLLLAALIAAAPLQPSAAESPHGLQPQQMSAIAALLARLQPTLRVTGLGIDHDHVLATLCAAAGDGGGCFVLRLDHPHPDCSPWGQFCASFPEQSPPPAIAELIASTLRDAGDVVVWNTGAPPAPTVALSDLIRPLLISIALILVPLGGGALLGAAWRPSRRPPPRLAAAALVVAPPLAAALLDLRYELVGIWDALAVGALLGLGLVVGLYRLAKTRTLALAATSLGGSLVLAELASRLLLPAPPAFPSAGGPSLLMANAVGAARQTGFAWTEAGAAACQALYGGAGGAEARLPAALQTSWRPREDARAHVLHLGDSMVAGVGSERFTDELNRIEPDVEHVNAAIPGTGPDVYLSLARLLGERHAFSAVVMHLTPNDWGDLDAPRYPCTGGQPLLRYGPLGTPLRRDPVAAPRDGQRDPWWLWQNSPPPYVLRSFVDVSAFAAHLAAAWIGVGLRLGLTPTAAGDDAIRAAHLSAILRAARDEERARGIALVVNVFRERDALEAGRPAPNGTVERMKGLAEELGIAVLDTWDPLLAAEQHGVQPFLGSTDPHFNATGHAIVAEWLHQQLPHALGLTAQSPRPGL
jgi:hypothetical protein